MKKKKKNVYRKDGQAVAMTGLTVASPLVTLHITAYTECLATARLGALEGLLARVRVAVDAQTAGTAKGLVAGLADVAVLACWELMARRRVEIVVVLPRDGAQGRASDRDADVGRRERLGQWLLVRKARWGRLGLRLGRRRRARRRGWREVAASTGSMRVCRGSLRKSVMALHVRLQRRRGLVVVSCRRRGV